MVSARIGTLNATAPEGEPRRSPRTAGTAEIIMIAGMLVFANVLPMISEVPDAKVTFLRSNAPKAAKVTSHTALFFRVFGNTAAFFVISRIVATPTSVAIVIFTFNAAVKTTVMIIGKKEVSNRLRLDF